MVKKSFLLMLCGFVVVIFCMSNVQAEPGSNNSFDSLLDDTGMSD